MSQIEWNDSKVIKYFLNTDGTKRSRYCMSLSRNRKLQKEESLLRYLKSRFNDIMLQPINVEEVVFRIVHKIEYAPKCVICGKPLKFNCFAKGYSTTKKKLISLFCSMKCRRTDKGTTMWKGAIEKTNLERYGAENFYASEQGKETAKRIMLDNYGVVSYLKTRECKDAALKKYGVTTNIFQSEEIKQRIAATSMKRYGVSNPGQSSKAWETRFNNNSWNSSKIENEVLSYLHSRFSVDDIFQQYKDDERYPYRCDFYIKSIDVFIEVNGIWTHGPHHFNANNVDDIALVNKWRSLYKADNSKKMYLCAIDTFARRDVEKLNAAKRNDLNYFAFYGIDIDRFIQEFETFLLRIHR